MYNKKIKVLITGASGFLGSNIIKFLSSRRNISIIGIYRKKKPIFHKNNIKYLKFENKKVFAERVDIVIHSGFLLPHHKKEGDDLLYKNILLSKKIINNIPKFDVLINISSMSIYDGYRNKKIYDHTIPKPKSIYGLSKLKSENILKNYCKKNKIKFCSLRPSGIIGKKSHGNTLSNILKKMISKKKLRLFGYKNNFNEIIYVNNFLQILKKIIYEKKYPNYLNLASSDSLKFSRVVEKMQKSFHYKKKIEWINSQENNNFIILNKSYKFWSVKKALKYFINEN